MSDFEIIFDDDSQEKVEQINKSSVLEYILELVHEIPHMDNVTKEDNILILGVNSLQVIKIVNEINMKYGVNLQFYTLFKMIDIEAIVDNVMLQINK